MPRKIKIAGCEFEWYDLKTKFKKILRSLLYSAPIQWLICQIFASYMLLVYATSKRKFINSEEFIKNVEAGKPVICCFWHNRLMMVPFLARHAIKRANKNYRFITLASNHGDGKFVGKVMEKFGFVPVYGSTKHGRKSSRGIDFSAFRHMIKELKSGKGLGITPDGPRGPNQKINGEIVNIARISGAILSPVSYSSSNFIEFNSWDKFKLPLPFSRLNFYFGDPVLFDKNDDEETVKNELEKKLNEAQEKSAEF